MDLDTALAFARGHDHGILATIRRDGRPQLSTVLYVPAEDGTFSVSVTADRAKTRNLARDPRFSLHVASADGYTYVVFDGVAELGQVARTPDDAGVEALVDYYRRGAGEHPDWDEFRRVVVAEQRLLLTLRPERAYGVLPEPATS